MQKIVDICEKELLLIGMTINCLKSACMRIGSRFNVEVDSIVLQGRAIPWVSELKYLGLTILSGKTFKINLQRQKQKYFGALNSIFGRVGLNTSPVLLCSLIHSFCVPTLLYGSESIIWPPKMLKSIDHAYSLAFMKIFKTYDASVVKNCQNALGYLPLNMLLDVRKLNFFSNLFELRDHPIFGILLISDHEVSDICAKYGLIFTKNVNWKRLVMQYFADSLNIVH